MTTVTIQLPDQAKEKLYDMVKELGGEILSTTSSGKSSKKDKLLKEIRAGLKDVKNIREGKAQSYSMSDLLNG